LRALPVVEEINRIESLYTTSSCSGRVTVIDAKWPWEREDALTVFKSHEKISLDKLRAVLSSTPIEAYWLLVRGPILHVVARDEGSAVRLLRLARESGFKHSGIADATSVGFLVELIGSSQLTMPLVAEGRLIPNARSLETLITLANAVLEDGWNRLERLKNRLKSW